MSTFSEYLTSSSISGAYRKKRKKKVKGKRKRSEKEK
jgi:hypothetical protein